LFFTQNFTLQCRRELLIEKAHLEEFMSHIVILICNHEEFIYYVDEVEKIGNDAESQNFFGDVFE
jgi:hypothetical protein